MMEACGGAPWNCQKSPAADSIGATFAVEMTSPAASTWESGPKWNPDGLIRTTVPLAERLPKIWEGFWSAM